MSKVYEYFKDKVMQDAIPTMNEIDSQIESANKLEKAERILKTIQKDSNPTYLKKLVDEYFVDEEAK